MGFFTWFLRNSHRTQTDSPQQPRLDGPNFVHVLRLETLPVAEVQQAVVRQAMTRHVVEGKIAHNDPQLIFAAPQEGLQIKRVWRAPNRPGPLTIHIYHGSFSDRRIEPGLHAGSERLSRNRLALPKIQPHGNSVL